jgi:hypothetical protein
LRSGKWRKSPRVKKLSIWFIFSAVVALTPFFLGIFQSVDRNQKVTMDSLFGSGQLLLVCVVLAAAALGELVVADVHPEQQIVKSVAIGSCIYVIIFSSLWFADISADMLGKNVPDPRTVSLGSLAFYVWALASSVWCLVLTTAEPSRDGATRRGSTPAPHPSHVAPSGEEKR